MIRVGKRNSLTDVAGIKVGNAQDEEVISGVTVVLPDGPVTAAVDVRGGGPGTRDTDALDPTTLVEQVHGIVLSGGSAFGLEAAGGVMSFLAAQGRGFQIGDAVVPIVPSAVLFDLHNGGNKDWGEAPPYRQLAMQAVRDAAEDFALGNHGAGCGAVAGAIKGGLGTASARIEGGATVAALVAVNCYGSTTMTGSQAFWAWPFEQEGEFGGKPPEARVLSDLDYHYDGPADLGGNTTIAVVATDAVLTKAQAKRVAMMAHDGMARAIRPIHTLLDGDTVFALSTGQVPLVAPPLDVTKIGMLAADCLSRAIARGVYEAEAIKGLASYRDGLS